jgi:hypothetical protein
MKRKASVDDDNENKCMKPSVDVGDLMWLVFQYLTAGQIMMMSHVCKSWKSSSLKQYLWNDVIVTGYHVISDMLRNWNFWKKHDIKIQHVNIDSSNWYASTIYGFLDMYPVTTQSLSINRHDAVTVVMNNQPVCDLQPLVSLKRLSILVNRNFEYILPESIETLVLVIQTFDCFRFFDRNKSVLSKVTSLHIIFDVSTQYSTSIFYPHLAGLFASVKSLSLCFKCFVPVKFVIEKSFLSLTPNITTLLIHSGHYNPSWILSYVPLVQNLFISNCVFCTDVQNISTDAEQIFPNVKFMMLQLNSKSQSSFYSMSRYTKERYPNLTHLFRFTLCKDGDTAETYGVGYLNTFTIDRDVDTHENTIVHFIKDGVKLDIDIVQLWRRSMMYDVIKAYYDMTQFNHMFNEFRLIGIDQNNLLDWCKL